MGDCGEAYSRFLSKAPYLLIEWHDPASEAVAFLAIESVRHNACGGGTRIKTYESLDNAKADAVQQAKAMELKFLVSRLPVGGAKTVIAWPRAMGDPSGNNDACRNVLKRWFRAAAPYFHSCYGTGPDQNTTDSVLSELLETIGISEPRYGLAKGLYGDDCELRLRRVAEGINRIVSGVHFGNKVCRVVDLAAGFGVAEAVATACRLRNEALGDKRVVIEGFGAVGAAAAYYVEKYGARIVGVSTWDARSDSPTVTANPNGLSFEQLINQRDASHSIHFEGVTGSSDLCDIEADVFIPAATTGTITAQRLSKLQKAGVTMIVPGANCPFSDTSVANDADGRMAVMPDFVVNCGMARTFAYFLDQGAAIACEWPQLAQDLTSTVQGGLHCVADAIRASCGVLAASYNHWASRLPTGDRQSSRDLRETGPSPEGCKLTHDASRPS